jgi:hypothetical protein
MLRESVVVCFVVEETMPVEPRPSRPQNTKKPGTPKGLAGLLLYGALTILGGLALIVAVE